jgi:TolB-like protein/Tfp pilus assembly protein PilF
VIQSSKGIFLSYASEDAGIAKRICDALRYAGIEVWFDQSELRGGDAWDQKIRRQIRDCALFVPIISAHTQARPEGYFRLEWKLAVDRSHLMAAEKAFLVPLVVDATTEPEALVPTQFRDVQWTRIQVGEVPAAFVDRIAALLNKPVASHEGSPERGVSRTRARRLPIALAALSVIAVAALVIATATRGGWLSQKPVPKVEASAAPAPVSNSPAAIPEKSVAVLPFVDMSEKKDQEYFSDGLSEELIDMLTKLPELRVPARTSSFYFKGKQTTIADIAKALNVAHVLEGSVRKAGARMRVTAQLIRADSGYHLWSQTYDREVKDVFKVQDEIAAAVVEALKVQLLATNARTEYRPANNEAYDHYLLGRHIAFSSTSPAQRRRAMGEFERSITIDPAFGPAYTGLAYSEFDIARDIGDDALANKAFRDAERGIELAPKFAEAYQMRGFMRGAYRLDVSGAEADLEHALSLDPANAIVRVSYAQVLATRGRLREAVAEVERAIATDPLSNIAWGNMGRYWLSLGNYAKAREFAQRSVDLDSEGQYAIGVIPESYILEHEPQRALDFISVIHDEDLRLLVTAIARDTLDQADAADAALKQLLEARNRDEFAIAEIYARRGDRDRAFEWLRRAREAHADVRAIRFSPLLDNLRSDPRYPALLAEWKLAD